MLGVQPFLFFLPEIPTGGEYRSRAATQKCRGRGFFFRSLLALIPGNNSMTWIILSYDFLSPPTLFLVWIPECGGGDCGKQKYGYWATLANVAKQVPPLAAAETSTVLFSLFFYCAEKTHLFYILFYRRKHTSYLGVCSLYSNICSWLVFYLFSPRL